MTDQPGDKISLLIVEDDDSLRDVLRTVLEMDGYEVGAASSATEALDSITAHMPSVILLDVTLPGMDGEAFCTELHRRKLSSSPHIILLTADARGRQIAHQVGAAGYLEKPFAVAALLTEIERVSGLAPKSRA